MTESAPLGARHPKLKRLRRLVGDRKHRAADGLMVVDGPVLVAEALDSDLMVVEVFAPLDSESLPPGVEGGVRPATVVHRVDRSVLSSILDPVNPRPLAAVVESPTHRLADLAGPGPVVVASDIADPGNLGTMIRSAEGAGAAGVVVSGASVDVTNPKVVRATAGSLFRLPVVVEPDLTVVVEAMRAADRPVMATASGVDGLSPEDLDLGRAALLIGNEARGLDEAIVAAADAVVTIPLAGGVESLNAGVAASVLCFEAARQRRAGKSGRQSGLETAACT